MAPSRPGDGPLVLVVGGRWPASPGDGCHAAGTGRRARAGAAALPDGRLAGFPRGGAAGGGRGVAAPAPGDSRPQAHTACGRSSRPVRRARSARAGQDRARRGGQHPRGVRGAAPVLSAVAREASGGDHPDRLYGTVGGDAAGGGRPMAATHALSVLGPPPSPRTRLAAGAPLELREATEASPARSQATPPSHGHWLDRPCMALSGVYRAAQPSRPNSGTAEG